MGLLGKVLKTAIDVSTTPIDLIHDTITLGGELSNTRSRLAAKSERLSNDLQEIKEELDNL